MNPSSVQDKATSVFVVCRSIGRDEYYSSKVVKVFSEENSAIQFVKQQEAQFNQIIGIHAAIEVLIEGWEKDNPRPIYDTETTNAAWAKLRNNEYDKYAKRFELCRELDIPPFEKDVGWWVESHTLET